MASPYTVATLAKEYGISIREVQECASALGLPMWRGAARVPASQVERLRPSLASARSRKTGLAALRERNMRIELNSPITPENKSDDWVYVECACCQLRLNCRGDAGMPLCGHCRNHFAQPGESPQRELARLRDHDERMRAAFVRARSAADEYRSKLREMIESRDDWREAAIKLVIDHVEGSNGRCEKCKQSFPCEPVRILSRVNYGFARKAETLAGFSDEELERHLHPRRVSDWDYFAALDDDDNSMDDVG